MRHTMQVFGIGLLAMAGLLAACSPLEPTSPEGQRAPVASATSALAGTWNTDGAQENCNDICAQPGQYHDCAWWRSHGCPLLQYPLCPSSVAVGQPCDTSIAPGNTGCWKFSADYATYYYCS